MTAEGPTVRRRHLGSELKKCRERAGMTQEQVSAHFEWHAAKVFRIESARVGVTARDVKDMLALYGVTDDAYRDAMMNLARLSKSRSWWSDYRDVLRSSKLIGLEAEAVSARSWSPTLIPGLLQTAEYARALFKTGLPDSEQAQIDRHIELRMARQKRLTGTNPLNFSVIIDEAVLRRTVGGTDVMRAQLERLLEVARLPNVNLQVLPLDAGEHAFMDGSVLLLEFPEAFDLDVVHLEGLAGQQYEEHPKEIIRYRRNFERLSASALNIKATTALIANDLEWYK